LDNKVLSVDSTEYAYFWNLFFERTGFEVCWQGNEKTAPDQSYRKELMLYLEKSLTVRDGLLSLLLGAKDPEIAVTYTQQWW
jgi:hypothetical protein